MVFCRASMPVWLAMSPVVWSQSMTSVFVPNPETSSMRFFLDAMVDQAKPIMFVGGAGCGKSFLMRRVVADLLAKLSPGSVALTAPTAAAAEGHRKRGLAHVPLRRFGVGVVLDARAPGLEVRHGVRYSRGST